MLSTTHSLNGFDAVSSFKDAAIHFLSQPFLTNEDYSGLGEKRLATDVTIPT